LGIEDEVAEAFKLDGVAGPGGGEAGFESGAVNGFLRVRVQDFEEVVFGGGFGHGEEPVVEAHLRFD